ncbi:MAG: hypothetical protein JO197_20970 [Acidobacteria bacterium]|nr:hypothetical protein [Acidobacteriota bacterium]
MRRETRHDLREAFDQLWQHAESIAMDLREYVDASAAETRQYVDASAAETRRHFDIVAENLRRNIDLVVDGIANGDERLTRESDDIRAEMRQGFADTQNMVMFSHRQLDGRLHVLEQR